MAKSKETIYLKDYKPVDFTVNSVNLDFELTEEETIVTAIYEMEKHAAVALVLDGEEIELQEVSIDNVVLAKDKYTVTEYDLTIEEVPDKFQLKLVQKILPHKNTALTGLYKSNKMYCTQCESQGFRRISYYFDRPDVMSKFTVCIKASKKLYPVLLSNGNCIEKGQLPYDRHYTVWEDPFKKPSYLFALVAGDLVTISDNFITKSGRLVPLQFFVERPDIDKAGHAISCLKKAMQWDEERYGREYDLDTYMVVAVHDFNMGAMENKGLNIFNASCVLANPDMATDANYSRILEVVGHEYFHNWSGNRVTCRDWFQLSLKEGFTVSREEHFMSDMYESAVPRIELSKLIRVNQFAEDAGPMAHPVQPQSYMEINNFYTLTVYEKGGEVIRMMRTILGWDDFRKGCDLYFKDNDGSAVTIEEFVKAMEQASNRDLSQFRLWYTQAGTPEITVIEDYSSSNNKYALSLKQFCPPTPGQDEKQAMHIPIRVALYDKKGNMHEGTAKVLELTDYEQTFSFEDIKAEPILSILGDFSAPVKLKYVRDDEKLAVLVEHDKDPFNSWDASHQLLLNTINAHILQPDSEPKNLKTMLKVVSSILSTAKEDPEVSALMLSLPDLKELVEMMEQGDPASAFKSRTFAMEKIVQEYSNEFLSLYDELSDSQKRYHYSPQEAGLRRLKNLSLSYLMLVQPDMIMEKALRQYSDADNMTDKMAVLAAIAHLDWEERKQLLERFYRTYESEPIAFNKWLSVQAMSHLPDTVENVENLLKHERFSMKNPNNVYALLAGFGANLLHFHNPSGRGYKLLADCCIELNSLNPQVASRLVNPFLDWKRYVPKLGGLMKDELERISAIDNLNPDLVEKVGKALADA